MPPSEAETHDLSPMATAPAFLSISFVTQGYAGGLMIGWYII
jgi:hypothetical protein